METGDMKHIWDMIGTPGRCEVDIHMIHERWIDDAVAGTRTFTTGLVTNESGTVFEELDEGRFYLVHITHGGNSHSDLYMLLGGADTKMLVGGVETSKELSRNVHITINTPWEFVLVNR